MDLQFSKCKKPRLLLAAVLTLVETLSFYRLTFQALNIASPALLFIQLNKQHGQYE